MHRVLAFLVLAACTVGPTSTDGTKPNSPDASAPPPNGSPATTSTIDEQPSGDGGAKPCNSNAECEGGVCEGEGCGDMEGRCAPATGRCALATCERTVDATARRSPDPADVRAGASRAAASVRRRSCPMARKCLAAAECSSGICEGEGCGDAQPGKCVAKSRQCTIDLRQYCRRNRSTGADPSCTAGSSPRTCRAVRRRSPRPRRFRWSIRRPRGTSAIGQERRRTLAAAREAPAGTTAGSGERLAVASTVRSQVASAHAARRRRATTLHVTAPLALADSALALRVGVARLRTAVAARLLVDGRRRRRRSVGWRPARVGAVGLRAVGRRRADGACGEHEKCEDSMHRVDATTLRRPTSARMRRAAPPRRRRRPRARLGSSTSGSLMPLEVS